MRYRLRTLMRVAATVPPAIWLFVKVVRHSDDEAPEPILDPLVLLGVVSWIAIYYHLVHKRLSKVAPPTCTESVAEAEASKS
jgi:hypothetical protein